MAFFPKKEEESVAQEAVFAAQPLGKRSTNFYVLVGNLFSINNFFPDLVKNLG